MTAIKLNIQGVEYVLEALYKYFRSMKCCLWCLSVVLLTDCSHLAVFGLYLRSTIDLSVDRVLLQADKPWERARGCSCKMKGLQSWGRKHASKWLIWYFKKAILFFITCTTVRNCKTWSVPKAGVRKTNVLVNEYNIL